MSRYLKIKVGDTAKLTHTITQSDIEKFVETVYTHYVI